MFGARPQNAPGCGRGDRPAQHLLAFCRPPGPQLELAAETLDRRDRSVDRVSVDALTGEQTLNVAVTCRREQQVLGADPGMTEHACLVIGPVGFINDADPEQARLDADDVAARRSLAPVAVGRC